MFVMRLELDLSNENIMSEMSEDIENLSAFNYRRVGLGIVPISFLQELYENGTMCFNYRIHYRGFDGVIHDDIETIKLNQTVRFFLRTSLICSGCGCQASHFVISKSRGSRQQPFLRLVSEVDGVERNMTIDHIYPLSKGGGNIKCNKQVMCNYCNGRKSNEVYDETHWEGLIRLEIVSENP